MIKRFAQSGVQHHTYIMDKEISKQIKDAFNAKCIKYQLPPAYCHRANTAEQAIHNFKNHLKAGLATVDPKFPLREWDYLLPHGELTLNLFRAARSKSKLSAWAYLLGQFGYKSTPLVPPGSVLIVDQVTVFMVPQWEIGWSVAPALDHYRCISCYFPST